MAGCLHPLLGSIFGTMQDNASFHLYFSHLQIVATAQAVDRAYETGIRLATSYSGSYLSIHIQRLAGGSAQLRCKQRNGTGSMISACTLGEQ